jgi:uroporphyrinogen-III decarboxylase
LDIPLKPSSHSSDISEVVQTEQALGDTGIVLIDTPDPLCLAASLFALSEFTIFALTEQKLFHQLLEKFAALIQPQTEVVARLLPGRHWRIYGPEYASPPYLPPALFKEYVVDYDTPMVAAIHRYGGFARIHSHGNLKAILDHLVATGCMGIDPIEPPPQGDVQLKYVRENYGKDLVLFGNLEISDIENLPTQKFAKKVGKALAEGTSGQGRGFVLMPSACPYGRVLSKRTLRNYETMVEMVEKL